MSEAYIDIEETGSSDAGLRLIPETGPVISDWKDLNRVHLNGIGEMETALITMDDEARYVFRRITPDVMKSEVCVDFSPPLATRVDGFNTYMAAKIAAAGMPVRIVGTDQTHRRTLDHAAKSTHAILKESDRDGICTPAESILIGYSMGAMKGMGMLSNAAASGRNIHLMLGIDPCLANPMDYAKHSPKELAAYFSREGLELGRILVNDLMHDNPLRFVRRSRRLLGTFALSPEFATNLLDKWIMLASGETGKLAEQVPQEAAMVLHFFTNSIFNDHMDFGRILGDRPNVRFVPEAGYHLSGGNRYVVEKVVEKVSKCEEMIKQHYEPGEMVEELCAPILPFKRPALKAAA